MWSRMFLGCDTYHLVLWFITYSMLGWLVESIYMSLCNKKITNRGFAKGPFCPIYGIGALTVFLLLRNYSNNVIILFVMGSLLATTLEFFTALLMIRLFGAVWWDYNNKPFNFKGILCLESTIAWGFYTVFLFAFLQKGIMYIVDIIPYPIGLVIGKWAMIIFAMDFLYALYQTKKDDIPVSVQEIKEEIVKRITK